MCLVNPPGFSYLFMHLSGVIQDDTHDSLDLDQHLKVFQEVRQDKDACFWFYAATIVQIIDWSTNMKNIV